MPKLNLELAISEIKKGNIVAFPTETVYGLGALANSVDAVKNVFVVKNRPGDNPLICHFYSVQQILEYVEPPNEYTKILLQKLTPGPISFLLKLSPNSELLAATGGLDTVICRIPNNQLTLELIKGVGFPIVGPSANISGRPSSTNPEMVLEQFGNNISGVLDGGNSTIGVESTILDCLETDSVRILRPGAIGKNELNQIFVKNGLNIEILENQNSQKTIPGNKYPHYSPKTPIQQIKSASEIAQTENYLILGTSEKLKELKIEPDSSKNIIIINLGNTTDLQDIAQNLYQNLQKVDSYKPTRAYLIKQVWPNDSLGIAIQNRLSKVGLN